MANADTETRDQWAEAEAAIAAAAAPERATLRKRLKGLKRRARKGQPHDRGLRRVREAADASARRRQARAEAIPEPTYPPELPATDARERLLAAIRDHQVVVVCGDTGSGKTTQLPKMCLELGRGVEGMIGHTQPRRIAAATVSARVAEELGGEVGGTVGFKMRFREHVGEATSVKLMTDGIALAEIRHDPALAAYDTLIIDEAHERSLNIDFLLGYLKRLLPQRPDLKLIITSATIDPERFSRHFGDAPIVDIEGRTHPVEVRYRPLVDADTDTRERNREQAIIEAVQECIAAGPGDILVFLPTERAIRDTERALARAGLGENQLLPLFARLAAREQRKVFQPKGGRRVVLATNVAETSLTVPRIGFVIDSGEARISRYSVRSKVQRMPIERIAQASADQRMGRCGREGPGLCIRLYAEEDYTARPRFTDPEIQRTNLAAVVLQMASLGLGAVEAFPFIDPPERRLINDGYTTLFELGGVDAQRGLTRLGERLAQLSVDPRLARMLIAAHDEGALAEVLPIAAALAIQDPRERPPDAQSAADKAHAAFAEPGSDFVSLLHLWHFWQARRRELSQSQLRKIAAQHYLSFVRMREWADLHSQLRSQVRGLGLAINERPAAHANVHRALLAGLLGNVARHEGKGTYQSTRNRQVHIFPGSPVAQKPPKWLVAAEISETSRLFARTVAAIERGWIERLADHLLKRSYRNARWQHKSQRVAADEQSTLYGLVINPNRRVNYGPIAPRQARAIFIRDALVGRALETESAAIHHNWALLDEVAALEDRARTRDIAVDEQVLIDFFEARLPESVYDGPTFEAWRKRVEQDTPDYLQLTRSMLMQRAAEEVTAGDYPDYLDFGGLRLPLTYRFEPGSDADGITLTVPRAAIRQIDAASCEWLVPGMRADKIEALLRGLPKSWRRQFVPVPDFARALHQRLSPDGRGLTEAMSAELARMTGEGPPPEAWDGAALEGRHRMRFAIVDADGTAIDSGRDLAVLTQRHGDAAEADLSAGDGDYEIDDVTVWDFGDLPDELELARHGVTMRVVPALQARGSGVALTVFSQPLEAAAAHRAGVRRLIRRRLASQVRILERGLAGLDHVALQFGTRIDGPRWRDDFVDAVVERAFLGDGEAPRTKAAFEEILEVGRAQLWPAAEALLAELDTIGTRQRTVGRRLEGSLPMTWIEPARDLADQLDHLIYPGFITATPPAWRAQYQRYLDAMARRLDVLDREPERDRQGRAQVEPLWARTKTLLPPVRDLAWAPKAVQELRWMLEELRVSVFAQHLGTRQPISPRRVEQQIERVECASNPPA